MVQSKKRIFNVSRILQSLFSKNRYPHINIYTTALLFTSAILWTKSSHFRNMWGQICDKKWMRCSSENTELRTGAEHRRKQSIHTALLLLKTKEEQKQYNLLQGVFITLGRTWLNWPQHWCVTKLPLWHSSTHRLNNLHIFSSSYNLKMTGSSYLVRYRQEVKMYCTQMLDRTSKSLEVYPETCPCFTPGPGDTWLRNKSQTAGSGRWIHTFRL